VGGKWGGERKWGRKKRKKRKHFRVESRQNTILFIYVCKGVLVEGQKKAGGTKDRYICYFPYDLPGSGPLPALGLSNVQNAKRMSRGTYLGITRSLIHINPLVTKNNDILCD